MKIVPANYSNLVRSQKRDDIVLQKTKNHSSRADNKNQIKMGLASKDKVAIGDVAGSDQGSKARANFFAYRSEYFDLMSKHEFQNSEGESSTEELKRKTKTKRKSLLMRRRRASSRDPPSIRGGISLEARSDPHSKVATSKYNRARSMRRHRNSIKIISDAVRATRHSIRSSISSSDATVLRRGGLGNSHAIGGNGSYAIALPDGLVRDVRGSVLASLLDFTAKELKKHMKEWDIDEDSDEGEHNIKTIVPKKDESKSVKDSSPQSNQQGHGSPGASRFEKSHNFQIPMSNLAIKGVQMIEAKTEDGKTKMVPRHDKGKAVCYKSAQGIEKALILDSHLDDLLEPYYTIRLMDSGKEKQTDNAHILLLPEVEKEHEKETPGSQNGIKDPEPDYLSAAWSKSSAERKEDPPGFVLPSHSASRARQHSGGRNYRRRSVKESVAQFVQNVGAARSWRKGEQDKETSTRKISPNESLNRAFYQTMHSNDYHTKHSSDYHRKHSNDQYSKQTSRVHHSSSRNHCNHDDQLHHSHHTSNGHKHQQTREHHPSHHSQSLHKNYTKKPSKHKHEHNDTHEGRISLVKAEKSFSDAYQSTFVAGDDELAVSSEEAQSEEPLKSGKGRLFVPKSIARLAAFKRK